MNEKEARAPLVHFNLFYTAAQNILRQWQRSLVILLCLFAILFPFIAALAILEGIMGQARSSVEEGADIYVTMDMYGRNGIIPAGMVPEIGKIDGVEKAFPRVISRIFIEGRLAVLLGLDLDDAPSDVSFVRGTLPKSDEVAVGQGMAGRLGLKIGDNLSIGVRVFAVVDHVPYMQRKVYRISGIFDSDTTIWTSDLVLMNLSEALATYEMEDFVTDIAVTVRPGALRSVAEEIRKINAYFRIQTRGMVMQYLEQGFSAKGGIFTALYTVALALGIPVILVVSGFGLSERRRAVGILKAAGWQTHEVLEMVFWENVILALIGAMGSFVIAVFWVRLLDAPLLGRLFVSGIENLVPFAVPARFLPAPLVLSLALALVLTLVGSIVSTWRAASVSPAETMR